MTKEITDFFKMNDVKYKENYRLSLISPIKIGGQARYVAYPNTNVSLVGVVNFLQKNKIKYKILGRMSNVLPPDKIFDGVIIRTDRISQISLIDSCLEADAGASLPFLAKITADTGLSGLEELSGIPGSIGGAVRGNAGAFGREISHMISSVTIYDCTSFTIEQLSYDQIDFGYRYSSLMRDDIVILSVRLTLSPSDSVSIKALIQQCRERRIATQPVGQASLGSTFKRPAKDISAAKLIDDCGLKGKGMGGAKISEKHAGFIVNCGGATAADYLRLADYAKNKVFEKFGINLEREIEVI